MKLGTALANPHSGHFVTAWRAVLPPLPVASLQGVLLCSGLHSKRPRERLRHCWSNGSGRGIGMVWVRVSRRDAQSRACAHFRCISMCIPSAFIAHPQPCLIPPDGGLTVCCTYLLEDRARNIFKQIVDAVTHFRRCSRSRSCSRNHYCNCNHSAIVTITAIGTITVPPVVTVAVTLTVTVTVTHFLTTTLTLS